MSELTNGSVTLAVFTDMRNRYNAYVKANNSLPDKIYTKTGGSDYVILTTFDDMVSRYDKYVTTHGGEKPSLIYIVKPLNKPALIISLEKLLNGTINGITDFYGLIQQHGKYSYYDCEKYPDINTAIIHITTTGLNCADYVHVGVAVLEALIQMGVKHIWTIEHVYCNNSSGHPDPNAGHFLLKVDSTYVDFAEAASGRKPMGSDMCSFGFTDIIGHTLC